MHVYFPEHQEISGKRHFFFSNKMPHNAKFVQQRIGKVVFLRLYRPLLNLFDGPSYEHSHHWVFFPISSCPPQENLLDFGFQFYILALESQLQICVNGNYSIYFLSAKKRFILKTISDVFKKVLNFLR